MLSMRSWVTSKMRQFLDLILTNKTVKAWTGAVLAAGSAVSVAVQDGVVDGADIGTAVGAFIVALGLVYRVPNGKAE